MSTPTSPTSSPTLDISAAVMRWCEFYTRELPSNVATERQDELASDLYEQTVWAQDAGVATQQVRRSILARAVRGVPADLSWRHAQRRNISLASRTAIRARQANSAVVVASVSAASLIVLWGLYVLTRVMTTAARGGFSPWSNTTVTLGVATALAALGLVLMARKKTRALGTLWLIVPTAILIPTGLSLLYPISATVGVLFNQPEWAPATHLLTGGLSLFLVAASIWNWPSRPTSESAPGITKMDSL
ncbi:hypothetical protein B0I08_11140 [Glaciihabitans tibetensis]|uniref:Uncharacterized protein n=1 Tax=Glaciihabitans tibetensis TaxID=1266600 RepID=A0A2T0V4C2_9MICO|nr:hypothetical protein [Glaciihabitans tibetensis]PRY65023.1 hypothetical protein B0I08_11140 [Glaciihabitans tibetensis]